MTRFKLMLNTRFGYGPTIVSQLGFRNAAALVTWPLEIYPGTSSYQAKYMDVHRADQVNIEVTVQTQDLLNERLMSV